jgi:hypothetical protein
LREHLACVDRRVSGLRRIDGASALDQEALAVVEGELCPAWEHLRAAEVDQAGKMGLGLDEPVPPAERCLSPSDFGFHNALRCSDGNLTFLDFEYAGWDDPAKTVCDFFCQPQVPLPPHLSEECVTGMLAGLANSEASRCRTGLLLGVYWLKWCCIMLNDFLAVGSRRRAFVGGEQGADERKRRQLDLVRQRLRTADFRSVSWH